jgi:subtilisin family serine protease
MAMAKRAAKSSTKSSRKATKRRKKSARVERLKLAAPAGPGAKSLSVKSGVQPAAQTVVYIHGIANKPEAAILKCQWDTALFGVEMGDRTRMAYWVNREYYPRPLDEDCSAGDLVSGEGGLVDNGSLGVAAASALATGDEFDAAAAIDAEIRTLTTNSAQQRLLRKLSERMLEGAPAPSGPSARDVHAKIIPLPSFLRKLVTRFLSSAFLRDVNDFLFHEDRRKKMEETLIDRLRAGGGPFVVVAHSQGTMIAYNVLRRLTKADADVRLFVTLGSPLGLDEVQDVLKEWGPLTVPACVDQWVNIADRLDPVAADPDISNDFTGGTIENHDGVGLNLDSPRHPHSATGYLHTEFAREAVREVVGHAFAQITGRAVLVKDLVRDLENGRRETRHATLIQLRAPDAGTSTGNSLDAIRTRVKSTIEDLVKQSGDRPADAEIEALRRFVAARLTRLEIESLRTLFFDLQIERVWRNAGKRALIYESTHTIQARPANLGYQADGRGINWAVLDTGIRADHPHFAEHSNVVAQWDCTKQGDPRELLPGKPGFGTLDGNGHGTHVAGIIAGHLKVPLEAGGNAVEFQGMAPQAKLYGFKVLDDGGNGQDSWIIKALDKVAELNERAGQLLIHGVNLSLGGSFDPSVYGCGFTPLCQELRRLWNQGVLVCLAAGNEGYALLKAEGGEVPANMDLSIGDPANLEEAIAIGSIHKSRPHTYGVSFFSSRGPTADGRRKPDLVAPGEQILSAYHAYRKKANPTARDLYIEMSGTSMASPHVAGLLAAFLSIRKEFVGYPDRVKQLLLGNCTDLGRDPYIQGCGMPNLIKMLSNT